MLCGDWVPVGTSRFCLRICHRTHLYWMLPTCQSQASAKGPYGFQGKPNSQSRRFYKEPIMNSVKGSDMPHFGYLAEKAITCCRFWYTIMWWRLFGPLHLLVILFGPLNGIATRVILVRGSLILEIKKKKKRTEWGVRKEEVKRPGSHGQEEVNTIF